MSAKANTNVPTIPSIVSDLAGGISVASSTQNAYWLALALLSFFIIIPTYHAAVPGTPAYYELPFNLPHFDPKWFSFVSLLVLSGLTVAFAAAESNLVKSQVLAKKTIRDIWGPTRRVASRWPSWMSSGSRSDARVVDDPQHLPLPGHQDDGAGSLDRSSGDGLVLRREPLLPLWTDVARVDSPCADRLRHRSGHRRRDARHRRSVRTPLRLWGPEPHSERPTTCGQPVGCSRPRARSRARHFRRRG